MVVESINGFVTTAFNFVLTILTPVVSIIKDMAGEIYVTAIVAISIFVSYLLSKWNKFTSLLAGDVGLIIIMSILISLIFLLIGGI